MGYTELVYDGLAFPQHVIAPDLDNVASVTTEVVLLKHELNMLLKVSATKLRFFLLYVFYYFVGNCFTECPPSCR